MSRIPPFLELPPDRRPPPPPPSVRTAVLLAVLFGPLGLFYASPVGGAMMTFITFVAGFSTMGVGLIFAWPVCILWAYTAAAARRDAWKSDAGSPDDDTGGDGLSR